MEGGERIFYNALARACGGSYRTLGKLKEKFGKWEDAWDSLPSPDQSGVLPEEEWEKVLEKGIALVLAEDALFPPFLKEIPWPPFGIYVQGRIPKSEIPALAIVGTRKATEEGRLLARRFAAALGRAGVTIVSGLAFGIDRAAHEGCLEGGGKTLAVLGTGLEAISPRSHAALGKKIIEDGGAVISEYPLGAPVFPQNFIQRNRLISGLSQGVLLIEVPENSGALTTARFALEQNRAAFVVPGPATHPHFYGSHSLIRHGAELVTRPEEILASLDLSMEEAPSSPDAQTPEEKIILTVLDGGGKSLDIDKIAELAHLKVHIVNRVLSLLLIKNIVREDGDGYALL